MTKYFVIREFIEDLEDDEDISLVLLFDEDTSSGMAIYDDRARADAYRNLMSELHRRETYRVITAL